MTNDHFKKFLTAFLCVSLVLVIGTSVFCALFISKPNDRAISEQPESPGIDAEYLAGQIASKQRELFLSVEEEVQALSAKSLTVEFAVRAIPYEIEDSGTATAFLRGRRIPLRLKDGVLEGSARVAIADLAYDDDGPLTYRILLQNGATQQNQVITPFFYESMPFVGSIEPSYDDPYDGNMRFSLRYEVDKAYLCFGDKLKTASIYVLGYTYNEDGSREDPDLLYGWELKEGLISGEETFEVPENVKLRFYGEVVGESGLIYRYWLEDFVSPEYEDRFDFPYVYEDLETQEYVNITAPNGDKIDFTYGMMTFG